MKKSIFKWIALLVTVMMCFGVTGVFAVDAVVGWSLSQDFTDFTTPNVSPVTSLRLNNNYPEYGVTNFTPVKGLRGKAPSDTSLMLSSKEIEYPTGYTTTNPNIDFGISLRKITDKTVKVSFEIMNNDLNVDKTVAFKTYAKNVATGADTGPFFTNGTGALLKMGYGNKSSTDTTQVPVITVFGSQYKYYQYNVGEWYKVDIVFKPGLNASGKAIMDVYINGQLIWDSYGFSPTDKNGDTNYYLEGIDVARFQYTTKKIGTTNTYCAAAIAIDNLKAEVLDATPTITRTAMPHFTDFSYAVSDQDYKMPYNNGAGYAPVHKAINFGNFRDQNTSGLPTFDDGTQTGTVRYGIQNGVFGKPASDKVLYLYNPTQYFPDTSNGTFKYCNSGYVQLSGGESQVNALTTGDQFRFTISIARDNLSRNTRLTTQTQFKDSAGTSGNASGDILKIDKAGSVQVFNQSTGYTMGINNWNKFEIIGTVGEENKTANTVDVYVNGKLIASDIEFSATGSIVKDTNGTITSVKQVANLAVLRPGYALDDANKTGKSKVAKDTLTYNEYQATGWYFDDIGFETYANGNQATLQEVNLNLPSNNATIGMDSITKFNLNYTVGEFLQEALLNGVSATNGADIRVQDENGNIVDASASFDGKVVVLNATTRFPIYLQAAARLYYINDSYTTTLADNTAPNGGYLRKISGDYYTWSSSGLVTAGGGKAVDDKSFAIKMTDYKGQPGTTEDGSGSDPFYDYNLAAISNVNPTYEFSIRGPVTSESGKGNVVSNCSISFNVKTPTTLVSLDANGNINMNNKIVGKWEQGRWYKFSMTLYYATNTGDFYMNGNLIEKNAPIRAVGNTATTSFSRLKFATTIVRASETNPISTESAFDDIKMYIGDYFADDNSVSVTSSNSSVVVNEAEGKIHIPLSMSFRTLKSAISINSTALTDSNVYQDNSFESLATQFGAGNVVVATSVNGETFKYYEIVNDPYCGTIKTTINGVESSKLQNGTFVALSDVLLNNASEATMIVAQYSNKKLVKAALGNITADGTLSASMDITNAENSTVKIMILDNLNGIEPYCNVVTVNP